MILRNRFWLLTASLLALAGCSSRDDVPCDAPSCPAVADNCWYEPVDPCSCGPVVCSDASTTDGSVSDAASDDAGSSDAGDVDAAMDASSASDAASSDAAMDASATDAATADSGSSDAGAVDSGCVRPDCARPPRGCRYVGATPCSCGTLVCRDAGPMRACLSNADCALTDFCAFASSCGGTGRCETRPGTCIDLYDPVCGCDGATYGNSCNAAGAGVNVDYTGACTDCRDTGCEAGSSCQPCRGLGGVVNVCIPDGSIC